MLKKVVVGMGAATGIGIGWDGLGVGRLVPACGMEVVVYFDLGVYLFDVAS